MTHESHAHDAITPERMHWAHDALEGLFDPTTLQRLAQDPTSESRFADGTALRDVILQVINQLRPPASVSARSNAWRTYNTLDLRYLQGLTQAEVAAQMHMTVRNLRYEQQKAIEAVTTLLFSAPMAPTASREAATLQDTSDEQPEFADVMEVLRGVMGVLDAALTRQNLHVDVRAPASMPPVRANRTNLRQLLMCALGWMVADADDCTLNVEVRAGAEHVSIHLRRPTATLQDSIEEMDDIHQLAGLLQAGIELDETGALQIQLPARSSLRVLVIDDDPDAIELTRRYLANSAEFDVVSATKPNEAIRLATSLKPACIVLDLMMPDRDGWEVLTLLKTNPDTRAIPVVVSSVLKEHRLSLALGAAAVLRKPYDAAQLIEMLRSVIAPLPARRAV